MKKEPVTEGKTAEEILRKHTHNVALLDRLTEWHWSFVLKAMEEYASQFKEAKPALSYNEYLNVVGFFENNIDARKIYERLIDNGFTITKVKEPEGKAIKLLREIRDNSKLWRSKGPSGADQYQGMPPFVRLIDELLAEVTLPEKAEQWISVDERMPEFEDDGESKMVLCLGFKMSRPETANYEIMRWMKLDKPDLYDSKGKAVMVGWSNRWWNTNPDLYDVHYWQPLPEPPKVLARKE